MSINSTAIPDVLVLEPTVYSDERGFFFESFNQQAFNRLIGQDVQFVQDNHSRSIRGVLRGLHYQTLKPQGKLVRVVKGAVFDVTIDLRRRSPYFGRWEGIEMSEENRLQKWIPPGFAHGFLVISESADLLYKTTEYYAPECERCIAWNDPSIGIQWPLQSEPLMSSRDQRGLFLRDAELFE